MVLHVAEEAGREFSIPRERRLLVGFSQSVALNYRLAATHPDAVRGAIESAVDCRVTGRLDRTSM
jgi:hypothetical protein